MSINSKISKWKKNRKEKKAKEKTSSTPENSKPVEPTEQKSHSSPLTNRPSLTESNSNVNSTTSSDTTPNISVPNLLKEEESEPENEQPTMSIPASQVQRPSNPRVQQLKEKLGLLNDVSTSSDEDVPEHHLPPHMVSGPSAVHNMQPPPSGAEIPRDESKEQLPTVQNPSAAPSASTMQQQDKSARQKVTEFAQGTPEQSLQNATLAHPDAANIPRTQPPPAAVGRNAPYGHQPIIPPPQYSPNQQYDQYNDQYDQQDQYYDQQQYDPYYDQQQMYGQYPQQKVATLSNTGKIMTIADILLAAAGLALAIGTLVRRSRKDKPQDLASQAFGFPKQKGFMSRMYSKVKTALDTEPRMQQPMMGEPFPVMSGYPQQM